MNEKLVGVIHDGSASALNRAGLEIFRFIANARGAGLALFGSEGPMGRIAETRGVPYRVVRNSGFASGSFRDKVNAARGELGRLRPEMVYATSVACSPWVVAGKQLGAKVVLHVHELRRELMALLHSGATCIDVCAAADVVAVSGDAVASDLQRCLGFVPDDIIDVGVLLDDVEILRRVQQKFSARWHSGRQYAQSDRKLVVMWGAACHRNGIDIFVETARQMPAHDFLWIGAWTDEANRTALEKGFMSDNLDNFYCTGEVDNPYPLIAMCDLFVLTACEVDYPADLVELAALGIRTVCFSGSFDSWVLLPRAFYVLHGFPRADRLVKVISSMTWDDRKTWRQEHLRPPDFRDRGGLAHLLGELKRRRIL
jgi:hypothetical protein